MANRNQIDQQTDVYLSLSSVSNCRMDVFYVLFLVVLQIQFRNVVILLIHSEKLIKYPYKSKLIRTSHIVINYNDSYGRVQYLPW